MPKGQSENGRKHLFKKGYDPRRNKKGQPHKSKEQKEKEFDIRYALRQLFRLSVKIPDNKTTELMEPYLDNKGKMRCIDIALVKALQSAMNGNLKSLNSLLDRYYGKPAQTNVNIETDNAEDAERIREYLIQGLE